VATGEGTVEDRVARLARLASDKDFQALSRTLFGQAHRLAVMSAIARSRGVVNSGDLAADLKFRAQSSIQGPMRDLLKAGLLSELPDVGTRRKLYERKECSVWAWIEEVVEQFEQEGSLQS
jgi:hypothetical protein